MLNPWIPRRCCDGGGAPFEITFDPDPSTARRDGRNLTWVRVPRANITVGRRGDGAGGTVAAAVNNMSNTVTLDVGAAADVARNEKVTGLRYAWTDFVDCVLDNGNSSGIPAAPFRHWF